MRILLVLFVVIAAKGNPVLNWNALMIDAIRVDNSGPTLSSRNLAILHTAIYDAVNSIARTHQPYRVQIAASPGASEEAAAIAAGHLVVKALYPGFAPQADALLQRLLAQSPRDAALTNGLALGIEVARLALAAREADGAHTEVPYIPSDLPGQWRRTPPFFRPPVAPNWRYVDLFGLPEVDRFLPPAPPNLESSAYAAALNEVTKLGRKNSQFRTAEQSEIAVFWSDFSYTSMPPGHWHLIAANIAAQRANTVAETARLFALLSMAQADAAIVTWEAKYRWNLWRPVTAVHRANEDGNPATEPDGTWEDFLPAPPFPSYPSGHSTFSMASARLLADFYGTDAISFRATADALPGVTRSYSSLAACAEEIGMSRIYGGIHFSFDNIAGKDSGRKIGAHIAANWLLPNEELPRLTHEERRNGKLRLRVHARIGEHFIVEGSPNIRTWTAFATNNGAPGGVLLEIEPGEGHFFFRAVDR